MQDLVAEYQQYQDATYVLSFCSKVIFSDSEIYSVEEEAEYEEEANPEYE